MSDVIKTEINRHDMTAWQARARYLGIDAALGKAAAIILNDEEARQIMVGIRNGTTDNKPGLRKNSGDLCTRSEFFTEITGTNALDWMGGPMASILVAGAWEAGRNSVWQLALTAKALRTLGSIWAASRYEDALETIATVARELAKDATIR